jgi:hypothetical protein
MSTRVTYRTERECRAELEAIYADFPSLRDIHRVCCSGCAESGLADNHGWGSPIVAAWDRVEELRFLLGDDA